MQLRSHVRTLRYLLVAALLAPGAAFADEPPVAPTPPVAPAPIPTPAPADGTPPVAAGAKTPLPPSVPVATNGEPVTAELNPYVPWYKGEYGHNRVVHMSVTAALGLVYLASETVFKTTLAAKTCRWCSVPAFDRDIRNDLVWGNPGRADLLSTLDAYVLAPIVGFGLLVAADYDASWARIIDDVLPVAETVAITQVLTQAIKFTVGRQRPYAHFGDTAVPSTSDDNTSFISGHSVLGFSITAGAGLICHWRGYWTEPYVWATGIALSLSTEYLRMGADKHYLTDVIAGGIVGIGGGLTIPRLMRRDIKIVPVSNGAAVVGEF
jgi:membrane-associated phospholipid phosphatase